MRRVPLEHSRPVTYVTIILPGHTHTHTPWTVDGSRWICHPAAQCARADMLPTNFSISFSVDKIIFPTVGNAVLSLTLIKAFKNFIDTRLIGTDSNHICFNFVYSNI